jgi:hypothetical protein
MTSNKKVKGAIFHSLSSEGGLLRLSSPFSHDDGKVVRY